MTVHKTVDYRTPEHKALRHKTLEQDFRTLNYRTIENRALGHKRMKNRTKNKEE